MEIAKGREGFLAEQNRIFQAAINYSFGLKEA